MERATQERLVGATLLIVAGVILIPWLLDGSATSPGVSERELVLPGTVDGGNETRRISLEDQPQVAGGAIREIDARSVRAVEERAPAMNLPTPAQEQATTESPPPSAAVPPARFAKPMPQTDMPPQAPVSGNPATAEEAVAAAAEPDQSVASDPVVEQPSNTRTESVAAETPPPPAPAAPAPTPSQALAWAVQVGSFASQDNAERLAGRLRDKGYKAFVMRNVIEGRVRFRVRVGPVNQRSEAELLAAALREDRQPARILRHP